MINFHKRREGQVVVELLLILPVLMLMVFFVLEYGNIAYHTILANHASYEFARIGALTGTMKPSGKANTGAMTSKIRAAREKVFGNDARHVTVQIKLQTTGMDPMYRKHRHEDVIVTVTYKVPLIFPGTSWLLASEPKKEGFRKITATTRMPVEKTYASSDPK